MTPSPPSPPRRARTAGLGLPAPVWRAYALASVPLFLLYLVASETDGDLTRGIRLWPALLGALRAFGPALLLLLPVWHYTGWMERRGFGAARTIANHLGMAVLFAVAWHALVYLLLWAGFGRAVADDARQRWFIWQGLWGMMMYGAAAGGFSAWRAIERARRGAESEAQAHALLARAELAALRNRLEPHFLFNTLHSILALVRRDAREAEAALLKFSDLMRHLLDAERRGDDFVPLGEELEFTRDYLALESLRLGARLSVDWSIDDAALGHLLPSLGVQPIVENCIKHAFNPRSAPGRLRIAARVDAATQALHLEIADDGPGCAPDALAGRGGLGLATVARRLALAYGPACRLDVRTAPGQGFAVRMCIPAERTSAEARA